MTVRSTESLAGDQLAGQRTWRNLITEPIVVVALITTTGSIIAAVIAAALALQQYNRAEAATVPVATTETVTESVTVTSTVTVPPGPSGQRPPPDDGGDTTPVQPAGVFWAGELTFGDDGFSLDVTPPRHVDGYSVWFEGGNADFNVGEDLSLAEWTSNSVPGRDECAAEVAERGDVDTGNMSAGSQVCGKTAEGRIFLLEVIRIQDWEAQVDVTVWDK